MPRLGLALSGGGLRATLFHLGVVRFLRDAGLLGEVTHIVSVSGGSILGAHLALNWGATPARRRSSRQRPRRLSPSCSPTPETRSPGVSRSWSRSASSGDSQCGS